MLQNHMKR